MGFDFSNHSREQLIGWIKLDESAISSLQRKIRNMQRVSKSRLERLKKEKRRRIIAEERVAQLQREAHGG